LWNENNLTIKSVDLLGAAVDDEEVSTNPQDILIDQTNWGTPKSDYGQAIEAVVTNFTNSFSSKDNMLEPNPEKSYYPFQVYPSFETDRALGQKCDLINPFTNTCMITEIGDNHRGYLGYRKPVNTLTIIDDGAIDIVVDKWINRISTDTSASLE
jgi:hypothetical protein